MNFLQFLDKIILIVSDFVRAGNRFGSSQMGFEIEAAWAIICGGF